MLITELNRKLISKSPQILWRIVSLNKWLKTRSMKNKTNRWLVKRGMSVKLRRFHLLNNKIWELSMRKMRSHKKVIH